jgi:hypothetical protein
MPESALRGHLPKTMRNDGPESQENALYVGVERALAATGGG